jgi:multidrug efflux pump subunit AcrA (membrane-fusion protein)
MDTDNPSTQDVTNVKSQIESQEALLAKEQERLANLDKAVKEATDKANEKLAELRDLRGVTKAVKDIATEEGADPAPVTTSDTAIEQLNRIKESNRKKAFQKFFESNPELAQDENKVNQLVDRYNRLKSTEEFDTQDVLNDIQSAYYSIEGPNLASRQAVDSFNTTQFLAGSRTFSGTPVGAQSGPSLSREEIDAVNRLSKIGITAERVLELKKKGYLK